MRQPPIDISTLSPGERLDLIERLWESLSQPDDVQVTEKQRAELASRVAAIERGEMKTLPIEQVISAIRAGRAHRPS